MIANSSMYGHITHNKMLLPDAESNSEENLFQNINNINVDTIRKVQEDIDPDDIISLVFLLYDSSDTALQRLIFYGRVCKDIELNHMNLLYEWAIYAQRQSTWRYEFLEALAVCRLYSVIRKLGFNVANIKKHYLPENLHVNIYMDPIKKVLYRLCECMTTENLSKFKKSLFSFRVDISNHDNAEIIFLDLMSKKFIKLGQYNKDKKIYTSEYNIEQLAEILDSFSGLTELAVTLREIQHQVNNNNRNALPNSSNTIVKKYKSDLNKPEGLRPKKEYFTEIFHILKNKPKDEETLHNLKSDTQFQRDAYPIKNKNRVGLCCIINEENFYPTKESIQLGNKVDLSDRVGSSLDVIALEKTMKAQNFIVLSKHNLSRNEVFQFLKDVIQDKILPEDSIFMLCILSHGVKGHVYAADSIKIKVQDIQNLLDSDESHNLYDIPKVLIIQACQSEEESGADLNIVSDGPSSYDRYLKKTHFLVYWATAPEYEAFRDIDVGSIFIQCLCDVIRKKAKNEDLYNIFTEVTDCVSTICTEFKRAQVPLFESTLRKKLFLHRN